MTILRSSPTLFKPSTQQENNNVIGILHKKTASALRKYNENIAWLENQLEQGHIDTSLLTKLNTKVMPTTHKTPIDIELSKLYLDPKFASIIADENITAPSAMVHLAAKQLTLDSLAKEDFPPVCNSAIPNINMFSDK